MGHAMAVRTEYFSPATGTIIKVYADGYEESEPYLGHQHDSESFRSWPPPAVGRGARRWRSKKSKFRTKNHSTCGLYYKGCRSGLGQLQP